MGKNLYLRAKTNPNLKPELKMEVVWNTCDKELGGEIKSIYENYSKSSLSESHSLLEKISTEKQCIGIVYSYVA